MDMKIEVYNDWDHINKAEAEGEGQVLLSWDGEYRKGDIIEISGLCPGHYYMVNIDQAVGSALIYVMLEQIIYPVPFYEKKTSYNPLAFFGNRHVIAIREAFPFETASYRNLALNPFDQHDVEGIYPHASANVETRDEAVFAARNAIDGMICTRSHGEWPYESWGINRREDAEFRLDFGVPVDIDEIRLYTRADFPHDSYWVEGTVCFSDGTSRILKMERHIDLPHIFPDLKKKDITSLTLKNLIKADDPSPFPALTQIEVYGVPAGKA
ncbi:MAG: carbohydrate-binding protein [Lachnospiraceae bacterium]|nr:carbohydrate-binding protein [Lachnospiraceae bacterium]